MFVNISLYLLVPFYGVVYAGAGGLSEEQIHHVPGRFPADVHSLDAGDAVDDDLFHGHVVRAGFHLGVDFGEGEIWVKGIPAAGGVLAILLCLHHFNVHLIQQGTDCGVDCRAFADGAGVVYGHGLPLVIGVGEVIRLIQDLPQGDGADTGI